MMGCTFEAFLETIVEEFTSDQKASSLVFVMCFFNQNNEHNDDQECFLQMYWKEDIQK